MLQLYLWPSTVPFIWQLLLLSYFSTVYASLLHPEQFYKFILFLISKKIVTKDRVISSYCNKTDTNCKHRSQAIPEKLFILHVSTSNSYIRKYFWSTLDNFICMSLLCFRTLYNCARVSEICSSIFSTWNVVFVVLVPRNDFLTMHYFRKARRKQRKTDLGLISAFHPDSVCFHIGFQDSDLCE